MASTACTSLCTRFLAATSICMIIGGLLLPGLLQLALDFGIRSQVVWMPDSPPDVDGRFRGTDALSAPADIVQIWLFNITNVDDIRLGKKPVLEQVGPYVYRKFKIKLTSWWDREGRVACKEYDYFIHMPERTGADLNASVVTLNMPLIGVVESIHAAFGPAYQRLLDLLVSVIAGWKDGHVNGLFIKRTAQEMIWGYEDLLLQRLAGLLPRGMIKSTRVQLMQNMSGPEEALELPPVVYDTGRYNLDKIWDTVSFHGFTHTRCWNECTERVRGSDGTQFRPGLRPEHRLSVWVAPLFRAEDFVFLEHVTWEQVKFLRYWPDPQGLEPNECHFQTIRGLMNITSPMAVGFNGSWTDSTGPPIYVSQPHFCLCDEALLEAVEGLACNTSNHLTYMDVEPITGIPMRGHLTMMMSSEITLAARMHLEPQIAKTNNRSIVTPIFWTQEDIQANPGDLAQFRGKVYRVLWYQRLIRRWLSVWGACLLVALALVLGIVRVQRYRGRQGREGPDAEQGRGNGSRVEGQGAEVPGDVQQPLLQGSD